MRPTESPDAVAANHRPDAAPDRLPRRLGVWTAAAVLVGSTIGSGIFRVPSGTAERVQTLGAFSLVWIVGALIALVGALTIAELAAMYPRSGGIYVFLREAYGPLPAFLFGWTELMVIRPSALGAIAVIFAEYSARLFGFSEGYVKWVAAGAIVLLAAANVRSVNWGGIVQNLSTVAKVGAILGLALFAFVMGSGSTGALAGPLSFQPASWVGFGLALVSVMWAYDGWADLTFIAGEVKDPSRTMPRAIIGGVLAVAAIYLAINAAYLFLLSMDEMAASKLVASDAAQKVFGGGGAGVVAVMVMLSTFGALNGAMMTGPRIFYAMAEDGNFFRPIAAVHPTWRTPYAAILLAAGLGVSYVLLRSFQDLADAFVLGIWPFYALAVAGVYVLRRRLPNAERPYRTWGYPVVPFIFLAAAVGMLGNAAWNSGARSNFFSFGIILLGIPAYYLWRAVKGRSAAA
ncbi:APC family permease [Longimicrobium terrae]|uniref:Amino acid transporter n=1 Tax=Longimicrobium terrae TaxID=1639882 RepID=A0A841GX28_9BACT|nr:amino acid permease [Longimicrobium terrae]MBB4634881.1 amino acid transporter [Longimicrobium terrae]MBB6069276.1 amino acid transporter [Longimicrobium terrae]NNC31915.1 amino acid permease [Longimicrobium terrae]